MFGGKKKKKSASESSSSSSSNVNSTSSKSRNNTIASASSSSVSNSSKKKSSSSAAAAAAGGANNSRGSSGKKKASSSSSSSTTSSSRHRKNKSSSSSSNVAHKMSKMRIDESKAKESGSSNSSSGGEAAKTVEERKTEDEQEQAKRSQEKTEALPVIDINDEQRGVLRLLVMSCVRAIETAAYASHNCAELFGLLESLDDMASNISPAMRLQLIQHGAIGALVNLVRTQRTIELQERAGQSAPTKGDNRPYAYMPRREWLPAVLALSKLVRSCVLGEHKDAPTLTLLHNAHAHCSSEEEAELCEPAFLEALCRLPIVHSAEPAVSIATHVCWRNLDASQAVLQAICTIVDDSCYVDFYSALRILRAVLAIDGDKLAHNRVAFVMPRLLATIKKHRQFYMATELALSMLVSIMARNAVVRSYMAKRRDEWSWISVWLSQNRNEPPASRTPNGGSALLLLKVRCNHDIKKRAEALIKRKNKNTLSALRAIRFD
eukprot:TRINITY_DN65487_c10_g13_i2.p1 TRINITY_DN65487_c10_g13~~TRINITY_DN65487_c10_g13_i2.p1  ORF type:complete len:492 (+),score=248.36 TRINITY_DN65487_c10_g13_i2:511-1986(+)